MADWPLNNRVAATVRLQRHGGSPDSLLMRLRVEMERFPGQDNRTFRQALHAWGRALWPHLTRGGSELPSFEEFEREQEEGGEMATLLEANWMRWEAGVRAEERAQGVVQGIEQGRAEVVSRLLGRQAALKFGAPTAERLSDLLEGLTAREDLDRVSDWIIECATGDELLSRVSALRPTGSADGNGTPRA